MALSPKRRTWIGLISLLFVLGALRITAVTLHSPLVGYGNSWDMSRVQACVGLWPQRTDGKDWTAAHLETPYDRYTLHGHRGLGLCYLSSELLFVGVALAITETRNWILGTPEAPFRLKLLGNIKALVLSVFAFSLSYLFFRERMYSVSIMNAAVYAIILADPYNTLYLNTMYGEFSIVLFAYSSSMLLYYLMVKQRPARYLWMALCVSLLGLGFAKVQAVSYPFLFGALALAPMVAWKKRRSTWVLGAIVTVTAIVWLCQGWQMSRPGQFEYIRTANAADTFFETLLPAMERPYTGFRLLGLPDRCASLIGKSWYNSPVMQTCPEIGAVSRWRILDLVREDPGMVLRVLAQGLPLTKRWFNSVGVIEGGNFAKLDMGLRSHFFSFGTLIGKIPTSGMWVLYVLIAGAWIVAIARSVSVIFVPGAETADLPWEWLVPPSVIFVSVATAIAGDGYNDIAKHSHLSFSFIHFLFLLCLAKAVMLLTRYTRPFHEGGHVGED